MKSNMKGNGNAGLSITMMKIMIMNDRKIMIINMIMIMRMKRSSDYRKIYVKNK